MAAMASSLSSPSASNPSIPTSQNHNPWLPRSIPSLAAAGKSRQRRAPGQRRLAVFAVTEGSAKNSSKSEESIPSWAKPDSPEPPPWAKNESNPIGSDSGFEVPFFVYLLSSAVTAIAAIGSVFEYLNQKPVFGVVYPDSVFYVPLLGFFAFTGIPTSAFLWFKSVEAANKEAAEQDRRDGYK